MHFELTQRYRSSAADVIDAYADPELYPTLVGLPKLGGLEVLSSERTADSATLRIRFRFTGHLPGAVTAVIDADKLTWVQETSHDLGSGSTTFVLKPDHYPDRLKASGTFRVVADGDGARRTVTGDLKVRAPLVGGKVEQAIVSGLEEYLTAEAPAVDAYLGA
ncbi:DUF2505 domain-containing protein [Aquihabitans sp. G128]|uniref:DUF2505 domain-containing protein n=1 Tax=Aquihabitans sp. G128 TaxID=2849779 RepID=UPI001C214D60|nr:DUF2505 domain-containing protein [Aquihabitans sp. G128]QXC62523.1 DUF2505 domain-containing protein [Aquihabitans sp. G128]